MKIVSNTSPLIAFSALKKLDILKDLYKTIIIPHAVYEELNVSDKLFKIEDWIKVVEIKDINLFESIRIKLDYGESAALTYYLENKFDYCLLDDKQARKIARGLNVNVIGTIGILLLAKKRRLILSVSDKIKKLEESITLCNMFNLLFVHILLHSGYRALSSVVMILLQRSHLIGPQNL